MPITRINNCDIHYEQHGRGPDLVFVHGETHSAALFDEQVRHFSQRYRCLVYDRRGHCRSELTPYGYSLWNQTNDLASLMETLQVRKPVIVAVAMSTPIAVTYTLEIRRWCGAWFLRPGMNSTVIRCWNGAGRSTQCPSATFTC